ncbi:MAG TPA: GrpB family protein [Thermomicrobiales bacterium]|nr:GrpB family protein [Thermomicrobiales bacterium]
MAGDPHNEVAVLDYQPGWVAVFDAERERIAAALALVVPRPSAIEHVGSTAVAGMAAKPIVDIMVTYARMPAVDEVAAALAAIAYELVDKPEFTESLFFRRGETLATTIHLHVTTETSAFGRQMLRFRDALRASPRLAAEYAAFKRELAARFPDDRPSYTQAKGPFISGIIGEPPSS